MKRIWAVAIALNLGVGVVFSADGAKPGLDPALQKKAQEAISRGLDWLASKQSEKGGWSNENVPALTALPLSAFARSGHARKAEVVKKAVDFIVPFQVDSGLFEGAIYKVNPTEKGGGLPNYNTAIAIMALADVGDPKLAPVILKGRKFLAASQYKGEQAQLFHGGMGYDPPAQRPYADLSNSYLAYEAMWRTARFEEQREGGQKVDLDWQAALKFVQRCHNDPSINDQSWACDAPSEKGGFAYQPDKFRQEHGAYSTNPVVRFRSMPGMTYAGLLSYIYAGVDRSDPRVKATVNWIAGNWNLEIGNRNPDLAGKPEQKDGLYYMYNVMAKGLGAYGQDVLTLADGRKINWRNELVSRLMSLQKPDGSWVNEDSRYWEGDPVLVTAYTVLALESAVDGSK
jgi:squalene-hopene/tetraprenyl-beta-curcumene cyclase